MTRRDLQWFIGDVQRYRPLATVVLAVALVLPSLWELATGNLSAVTLLARLALALAVCAVLVWAVTGVILRYARLHAPSPAEGDRFGTVRPIWTPDPATRCIRRVVVQVVSTEDLLAELVETLDAELEQLTLLRFRLVVLGSLVAADQASWLRCPSASSQATTEQLRLIDLRRAAATSGITDAFWLDPEARLHQIAAQVDDAWGEMLHDRRRLLLEQVANIRSVADLAISALGRRRPR